MNSRKAKMQAIYLKDKYLSRHHSGVMLYAGIIALALCPKKADIVFEAAALHDAGKVGIPENILFKPGKLSEEEWLIMRQHPIVGAELVKRGKVGMGLNGNLDAVVKAIHHHHERWDGSGYPDGLTGEEIPLAARIIAVADAFDAMTTHRPYRRVLTAEMAMTEIIIASGKQFDPDIVKVLKKFI